MRKDLEARKARRKELAYNLCYDTGLTVRPTKMRDGTWGAWIMPCDAAELAAIPDHIRERRPLIVTIQTKAGKEWTEVLQRPRERDKETGSIRFETCKVTDIPLNVPITKRKELRQLRRRRISYGDHKLRCVDCETAFEGVIPEPQGEHARSPDGRIWGTCSNCWDKRELLAGKQ